MIPLETFTPAEPAQTVSAPLPWVQVARTAPYFITEDGEPWTPVGHNDALAWPPLVSILKRPEESAAYFARLRQHGVTCLRLMLEYAQRDHHQLERPVGRFQPRMVARWDRLFALAERHGIRLLLKPFDTFWMWKRWRSHPYNAANGGPCRRRGGFLAAPAAREALCRRLAFVIDRWGGSGALFGWDLWNEIHPAYADGDVGVFDGFITEIATFVRARERARYGRTHPITVSAFGPMLHAAFHSKELGQTVPDRRANDAIYRHQALDFASVHTYAHGTIDDPANTVDPAAAMATLTRLSIAELGDTRPFFDSEHGPIHTFKDQRRVLPEAFDDEYFRHVQWAHLASGGAGGGMRWPNRRPHILTEGMHAAQAALVRYLPLIDWPRFNRRNLNEEIRTSLAHVSAFGCGDSRQAVVWLLRRTPLAADGTVARGHRDLVTLTIPGLDAGRYIVTGYDTDAGEPGVTLEAIVERGPLRVQVRIERDLALAVRRNTA